MTAFGEQFAPARVLVVDNDDFVANRLRAKMHKHGWVVANVPCGAMAVDEIMRDTPDIVMLEVALPDADGLEMLGQIREKFPRLPVMCLSTRADIDDRIAALSRGGSDDYVTKPVDIVEVVLRLSNMLWRSRTRPEGQPGKLVVGDLVIDEIAHEVTRGAERISLTPTEFALLRYLARNAGSAVTKSEILREVWASDFDRDGNIVALYISYLRRKVDQGRPPMIHTLQRVGYVLRANAGGARLQPHPLSRRRRPFPPPSGQA